MVAETGRSGTVLSEEAAPSAVPARAAEARDDPASMLDGQMLHSLSRLPFQDAMTLIDRVLPVDVHAGRTPDPAEERVRFRANPMMAFPARDIETIERLPGEPARLVVDVNFLGLHGPSSPLPPQYTERIVQREDDHEALRDFLDFFNHRLVSFLRRIWLRWRYHLRYRAGGRDPVSRRILCLAGARFPAEADALPKAAAEAAAREAPVLLPVIGLLALYARSASVIGTVLSDHFGVRVTIVEFVRREVDIPPEARGRLGRSAATLGRDFVAGARVGDSLGKYRVRVGPVSLGQFRAFLPGGANHDRLCRLVELMQTEPLEWDLELSLVEGEAAPMRLGRSELGWTSWLGMPADGAAPVRVTRVGATGRA